MVFRKCAELNLIGQGDLAEGGHGGRVERRQYVKWHRNRKGHACKYFINSIQILQIHFKIRNIWIHFRADSNSLIGNIYLSYWHIK